MRQSAAHIIRHNSSYVAVEYFIDAYFPGLMLLVALAFARKNISQSFGVLQKITIYCIVFAAL